MFDSDKWKRAIAHRRARCRRGQVLISDDLVEDRRLMGLALARSAPDIDFQFAPSPAFTLKKLREQPPDVVILDVNLGEKTGIDVLRDMKRDGMLSVIAAIVMTSSQRPQHREEALAEGASAFFQKPETLAEYQVISEYIRQCIARVFFGVWGR